jgi:hypothetical protein
LMNCEFLWLEGKSHPSWWRGLAKLIRFR